MIDSNTSTDEDDDENGIGGKRDDFFSLTQCSRIQKIVHFFGEKINLAVFSSKVKINGFLRKN